MGQLTNSPYVRNLPNDKGVIVFVHGVLGNSVSSWSDGTHYWPAMLRDDPAFDGQNIYVYEYPSPTLGKSFSVDELADNMWLVLSSDGVLKHDSITFVSHSMGGVVTRAFILKYRDVVPRIRLLYFFATPTTGTPYARLASLFSRNPQFGAMYPMDSDSHLAIIQSSWLAAKFKLRSFCGYETQDTYGFLIVDRQSATNLCTERLDPIDADHFTIVKPSGPTSTSYRALKQAMEETALQPVKPGKAQTLDIEMAPFVITHRLYYSNGARQGTEYSLSAILRVRHTHVNRLDVVGEVPVPCDEYLRIVTKDGEFIDAHSKECVEKEPYYNISWVSWPVAQAGDVHNDQFVKFIITKMNHYGLRLSEAPITDYLGFHASSVKPKLLTTVPRLSLLIRFNRTSDDHFELQQPQFISDIAGGKVQFVVQAGSAQWVLAPKSIRRLRGIDASDWDTSTSQELFYATDDWNRATPVSKDPLR